MYIYIYRYSYTHATFLTENFLCRKITLHDLAKPKSIFMNELNAKSTTTGRGASTNVPSSSSSIGSPRKKRTKQICICSHIFKVSFIEAQICVRYNTVPYVLALSYQSYGSQEEIVHFSIYFTCMR